MTEFQKVTPGEAQARKTLSKFIETEGENFGKVKYDSPEAVIITDRVVEMESVARSLRATAQPGEQVILWGKYIVTSDTTDNEIDDLVTKELAEEIGFEAARTFMREHLRMAVRDVMNGTEYLKSRGDLTDFAVENMADTTFEYKKVLEEAKKKNQ